LTFIFLLGVDHVTWGLIDLSFAFLLFLWANVLIDFFTGQGGHYGSRDAAVSTSIAGIESGRGGNHYNRLSLDGSSGEERTAVESGTSSNDSLEMSRIKSTKRS
jgi:hypothetical protein